MSDEKRYRILQHGEIIQDGDEVDACRDAWRDFPEWKPAGNIGEPAPDPAYPAHRQYRRLVRNDPDWPSRIEELEAFTKRVWLDSDSPSHLHDEAAKLLGEPSLAHGSCGCSLAGDEQSLRLVDCEEATGDGR